MNNVTTLSAGGLVTRDQQAAFIDMDKSISQAIDLAKRAGVPQGLVVAALAGHLHVQTHRMVNND